LGGVADALKNLKNLKLKKQNNIMKKILISYLKFPIFHLIIGFNVFAYGQAEGTIINGNLGFNQIGGTPINPSAIVEMKSTNKGMLLPRLTTSQINSIASPTQGLLLYDTDTKCVKSYNGTVWECTSSSSSVAVASPMTTSLATKIIGTETNYGRGIAVDNSGNYYITGHFYGQIKMTDADAFVTSQGDTDAFIAKFNSAGVLLWKVFLAGYDGTIAKNLKIDASGNVYTIGTFSGQVTIYSANGSTAVINTGSQYTSQTYVLKFNTNGNLTWNQVFTNDYTQDLALDASGNVHIVGYFSSTLVLGSTTLISSGSWDIYAVKLNSSNGSMIWAFAEGGTSVDYGYGIAVDGNANVYLTGLYNGTASFGATPSLQSITSRGNSDIFISKYNSSGTLEWVKTSGSSIQNDQGDKIAVNSAGTEIYLAGRFGGTILFGTGLGSNSLTSAGNFDIVLAKYDGSGTLGFAIRAGGGNNDFVEAMTVETNGNLYFTGESGHSNCAFTSNSPSVQNFILNATCGTSSCFIAKYNNLGILQFVVATTNGSGIDGFRMTHLNGKTWVIGDFSNTVNFGFQQLTAINNPELFVWRFSEN
jgi:hypothetical protein